MRAVDLIRKKRDGGTLSTGEINWLVEQYTKEQIPDYQMSAWLMAVYWRGMDARETSDLTLAMARSGERTGGGQNGGGSFGAFGVTIVPYPGVNLDGAVTRGSDSARDQWSIGVRLAY